MVTGCASTVEGIGSLPAPPCRYGAPFLLGNIEDLGGGCVSVVVERVIAQGSDGDSSELSEGSTVRGRLGRTYAYRSDFATGDSVALFVQKYDDQLTLELFPYANERAQALWGTTSLSLELEEMSAEDCPERLDERRPEQQPSSGSGETIQTAPPPDEISCGAP